MVGHQGALFVLVIFALGARIGRWTKTQRLRHRGLGVSRFMPRVGNPSRKFFFECTDGAWLFHKDIMSFPTGWVSRQVVLVF